MISDAKLEANRRNAAKSTGPKTPEGKAASKMNALRHGLLSECVLVPDDDANLMLSFSEGMLNQLNPVGELEVLLVDRVIAAAWRLRRTGQIEVDVLNHILTTKLAQPLVAWRSDATAGVAFLHDAQGANSLSKLTRYESALERSFYRALHELQRVQARRAGEPVPAPVALDVTVDGGFVSQNRPAPTELPDLL
jgi:hypothetical protein